MLIDKRLIGQEIGIVFKAAPFSMTTGPTGMGAAMNAIPGRLERLEDAPNGDQEICLRAEGGLIHAAASEVCFYVEYSSVETGRKVVRL